MRQLRTCAQNAFQFFEATLDIVRSIVPVQQKIGNRFTGFVKGLIKIVKWIVFRYSFAI